MADAATASSGKPLQGLAKWLEPKKQYRKLLHLPMQSSIHIAFCSRAKQPTIERIGANGKAELIPDPQKSVQEGLSGISCMGVRSNISVYALAVWNRSAKRTAN